MDSLHAPWRIEYILSPKPELKEGIFGRIGRSTDDGDAVIQAFWLNTTPHQANARNWAATADLQAIGRDRSDVMRQRAGQPPRDQADTWDMDSFAPQEDTRPTRRNVRAWR